MIHKIKAMYDNGDGATIKDIGRTLGITRNNVAIPIVDRIIHHLKIFMLGGEHY